MSDKMTPEDKAEDLATRITDLAHRVGDRRRESCHIAAAIGLAGGAIVLELARIADAAERIAGALEAPITYGDDGR